MAEQVELTQLVGSWRLVSLGVTYEDTKERTDLYGPHPAGYRVLSPNRRISFLFTRADRTPPQTDADRATLFSAMTAYTGLVRIEAEDRFVITVAIPPITDTKLAIGATEMWPVGAVCSAI
jgi:hypothetical protein